MTSATTGREPWTRVKWIILTAGLSCLAVAAVTALVAFVVGRH